MIHLTVPKLGKGAASLYLGVHVCVARMLHYAINPMFGSLNALYLLPAAATVVAAPIWKLCPAYWCCGSGRPKEICMLRNAEM